MEAVKNLSQAIELLETLSAKCDALEQRIAKLEESGKPTNTAAKEMTDEDARNVLFGELKDVKHNDAAKKLGLSYGQIYSCRLEYTFKHVHKEMKDKNIANRWAK